MPSPQTGATQYHAQLKLLDKGRTIKGLVVFNRWDLEPWDLLNGLALGCHDLVLVPSEGSNPSGPFPNPFTHSAGQTNLNPILK